MSSDIIAKCMAISMSHFLNTPYKEQSVIEMYAPDGFENRASGICHYCSIDTFRSILLKEKIAKPSLLLKKAVCGMTQPSLASETNNQMSRRFNNVFKMFNLYFIKSFYICPLIFW